MALIVQKYGGTSVGNTDRILHVAKKIKALYDKGNSLVVVVSARSGVTNDLIARAKTFNPEPDQREMDMLLAVGEQETIALMAIALQSIGVPAISRTGAQAGILTDLMHMRARILDISGGDIRQQLDAGKVVIVAGFQGVSRTGDVTTLGRGGSDLTAIALAYALKSDECQIFTDVNGIYTADPRIVPTARKMDSVAYEELLEMAAAGSKVMQARSVEFAQKFNVEFEVRSSFNDNPGTLVKAEAPSMEDIVVSGIAVDKQQAKVTVSELPDKPGMAALLFERLGEAGVIVDMIIQNVGRKGLANLSFTVARDDVSKAEKTVKVLFAELGGGKLDPSYDVAKLSVVGVGMRSHSGVAAKFFATLASNAINILMISTSEIKISVAIKPDEAEKAANAVHEAFELGA